MIIANSWALVLIPAVAWVFWRCLQRKDGGVRAIPIPDLASFTDLSHRPSSRWRIIRPWLRWMIIGVIVMAILRPQWHQPLTDLSEPGVDIVIAMDVSGSMAAEDFAPENRLSAAKTVAKDFVLRRSNDRIGMVVFGTYALTQCPLTLDQPVLTDLISKIELGQAGQDTALGLGLASAVNRLTHSTAKTKLVILITDGVNNAGGILPDAAAEIARRLGIKVYCIGIGKLGGAPIPVVDEKNNKSYEKNEDGSLVMTEIDESTLKSISKTTGGRYFRATDTRSLESIYKSIDSLEKSPAKMHTSYRTIDIFPFLLMLAFVGLVIDLALTLVVWRVNP
ncbi:VWA domain-containing protein [bacterium]|nr:VWA domain-containing protein [bacterium]